MQAKQEKYTIFQNINWYLKKTSKKFPKLKYGLLVQGITSLSILVATSGVPTLIIWGLQRSFNFSGLSVMILSVCIGLGCLLWGQSVYKTWLQWENANFRLQLTVDDGMGFLISPFEESIDTEIQKIRVTSSKHGYEDDDSGVDVLWPSFVSLGATLVSVLVIAVATVVIEWWSPVVILMFSLISARFLIKFNDSQRLLKASVDGTNFYQKYLYQEAFKLESGKDIRMYSLRNQYQEKIEAAFRQMTETQRKINLQKIKSIGLICLLDTIQLFFMYVPLIIRVSEHSMSLPVFTFFLTLLGTLSTLVRRGATEFSKLIMANEDVTIGREYLDYVDKLQKKEKVHAGAERIDHVNEIEFRNVSYHYPNDEKDIIRDISFTIKKDASVALVGLNGAGKTTLISLMMGLLKPTAGEILINGISSKNINMHEYSRLFSPIFQSGATFADTIEKNITFHNKSKFSTTDVLNVSGLASDVMHLKNGENTALTQYIDDKGISLSGGQSQKLMMARALYKDGQVLILDEPTSALDPLAESNLYRQYHELSRNKFSIFISHRLASTQFADVVFFIKNGRLVDSGTHAALLKSNEEYANLYHVQSKYYVEGDELGNGE